jgi:hypothetical protein
MPRVCEQILAMGCLAQKHELPKSYLSPPGLSATTAAAADLTTHPRTSCPTSMLGPSTMQQPQRNLPCKSSHNALRPLAPSLHETSGVCCLLQGSQISPYSWLSCCPAGGAACDAATDALLAPPAPGAPAPCFTVAMFATYSRLLRKLLRCSLRDTAGEGLTACGTGTGGLQ